jgi:integrase
MIKLPYTISEAEFLAVTAKIKNKKHKLAFYLGFYAGLRVSELIALNPENIKDGFIHVIAGKGNKDRDIPIPTPLQGALKHLPVGISRQGLHKAIKQYFPLAHMHTLRHSCATFYINEKGMDVMQVKALLGHADVKTTQIYTHVRPEHLKAKFAEMWK